MKIISKFSVVFYVQASHKLCSESVSFSPDVYADTGWPRWLGASRSSPMLSWGPSDIAADPGVGMMWASEPCVAPEGLV